MMSIAIRAERVTSIPNTLLDDDRLSFAAKGMMALAISMPDWVEFDALSFVGTGRIGMAEFLEAIHSLEQCGYIVPTETGWARVLKS